MISKSQTIRQMIILSLAVLLLPIVIFPSRLGTQLMSFSYAFVIAELVFYGAILFWSNRDTSLGKIFVGASMCLSYRLLLGALFGALVSVMYVMNFKLSLSLGLVSYVPAILCHVVVTPFIIKPFLDEKIFGDKKRPRLVIDSNPGEKPKSKQSDFNKQAKLNEQSELNSMAPWDASKKNFSGTNPQPEELSGQNQNGFDRATQYIGENGSVLLAVVIDNEGLPISNFIRENISLDDWAPLALLFKQKNNSVLDRVGVKNVDQIALTIDNMRVTIASEEDINLMVVADIQQDDVLNIRITQGMEIIKKYMAERYSQELLVNAENKYV